MPRRFVRTCQACDYELILSGEPKDASSNSFIYRKCPKCKSEAFDHGSWRGHELKPWRDRFKTLTGNELTLPADDLEKLIDDYGEEGLFEGNELYQQLIAANH